MMKSLRSASFKLIKTGPIPYSKFDVERSMFDVHFLSFLSFFQYLSFKVFKFAAYARKIPIRYIRLLQNYCVCHYGVKILLKILIYRHKLRFFVEFCLVLAALITFFNNLFVRYAGRYLTQ